MRKSIIIGTAGHIDHGKTSLVKALTGIDTDRLPEEKERGITIDIGFAHMSLGDIDVSFIDVPGHERFIKNMLAGVGGIDLVLLVVAADESIKPQTIEHFDICRLLQIPSGMVVITKADLVDNETLSVVRDEIAGLVQGSFLENGPVCAVSSRTMEGIDDLKEQLLSALQEIEQRKPAGIFRLPIDRVFSLRGHGTVVTGTLLSGKIRKDEAAEILPSHLPVKIRSIHAHNENVEEAVAGQRTALNLQGIDKEQLQRGDTLTEPNFFQTTSLLDVRINTLKNSRPILQNSLLRFHHTTNDLLARVTLFGVNELTPGESGYAQLRLQRPVVALSGDHFILRRHSPLSTVGGGIILDHFPLKRRKSGDPQALKTLQSLDQASVSDRLAIAVGERGEKGATEAHLVAKTGLRPEEIRAAGLQDGIILRNAPLLVMSIEAEQKILSGLQSKVAAFHRQNPLLPGIPKEELRSKYFSHVPPEVFQFLLLRARDKNLLQFEKDVVSQTGRIVALTSQEMTLAGRVEEVLNAKGLEFPGFVEIGLQLKERPEKIKEMLYLLVRQGKVVKVSDDYFVKKAHWEKLKQRIAALKAQQRTFSVPDFKSKFGVTRKYAIPLLERLDQEGITRRSGNERIIL
jgi:selenocysteine-specific elongation factor